MLRSLVIAVLGLSGLVEVAPAEQLILTASESVRVVNPGNAGDVRTFYKFSLPEMLATSDVILAVLTIPTEGSEEAPVAVGMIENDWSEGDNWSTLATALEEDLAYGGNLGHGILTSNHLELSGEGTFDLGIEVTVTDMVTSWLSESGNYGVCVRGVAGRSESLASILPANMATPELLILYTSK